MGNMVQHLSVRVPWHDSGWNGTICTDPARNTSCVLLNGIGPKRDDAYEQKRAGLPLTSLGIPWPPCVAERGTFLNPYSVPVPKRHPYRWNEALQGITSETLTLPAWSVHATPYYWMMAENAPTLAEEHRIVGYDARRESEACKALGFNPRQQTWLLHGDNQQALIETFFRDVTVGRSLVFFYLRHSPFDDVGRILVGAALIRRIALPGSWPTHAPVPFPNHMWETTLEHTLRPDGSGGMLLPLQQLAKLAEDGHDVTTALAPPVQRDREFSYVTEHVAADTAVESLMALRAAADAAEQLGCPVPQHSLDWLDEQLAQTWERRGVAPGLPALVGRLGFRHPAYTARLITTATDEGNDPWDVLERGMAGNGGSPRIDELFTAERRQQWSELDRDEKRALRLLSRFDLSRTQLDAVLDQESGVPLTIGDLLDDPYHLVTHTLDDEQPILFDVVDRGCYGAGDVLARHPLPATCPFDHPADHRRIEALIAEELRLAARDGHTLLPVPTVLARIAARTLVRPPDVDEALLRYLEIHPDAECFAPDTEANWPVIARTELADGTGAYKLRSLLRVRETVRDMVDELQSRPRHSAPRDLAAGLRGVLKDLPDGGVADRAEETRAQQEKLVALTEMYESRFTILNGRAGTGKTTLIRTLVSRPEIHCEGVLLLAPTGKARVQLSNKVGVETQTIAQFLTRAERFDPVTGRYTCTGETSSRSRYGLVVVDEASMLTETMLAALVDALDLPDRLILVGDPRQLPPIGDGRPFVDLDRAARRRYSGGWPRTAPGWAELTVRRRQSGARRDDLMLADWFSGGDPSGEGVWERLRRGDAMDTLRAVHWAGRRPEEVLEQVLEEELGVRRDDGGRSFAASYGATVGQEVRYDRAAEKLEKWQVLSPLRNFGAGSVRLNRHMKETYRRVDLMRALEANAHRRIPRPIGSERIVFGDKVVNLRNRKDASFRTTTGEDDEAYLANGEIGVVVGDVRTPGTQFAPGRTVVEYSSQLGRRFDAGGGGADDTPPIELAWALTVHKAQGSEFDLVIVMLPARVARVSREMIYTALTRQTCRVVLCHEAPLDELADWKHDTRSDTWRRLTDLTIPPTPAQIAVPTLGLPSRAEDAGYKHITRNGIRVRSKNELIITQILDYLVPGAWEYEEELVLGGIPIRPDFTIRTPDGRTVFWEHLGMLDDAGYAASWERRRALYTEHGITEGGGPRGVLFTTDDRDGVDVRKWEEQAARVLFLLDEDRPPSTATAEGDVQLEDVAAPAVADLPEEQAADEPSDTDDTSTGSPLRGAAKRAAEKFEQLTDRMPKPRIRKLPWKRDS